MAIDPLRRQTSAAPPSAAVISAHSAPVEVSIQIGEVARVRAGEIWVGEALRGIQRGEACVEGGIQIDRAVLLAGSGDHFHFGKIRGRGEAAEKQVERIEPHPRIGMHLAIRAAGNESARRSVLREVGAEIDGELAGDFARCRDRSGRR